MVEGFAGARDRETAARVRVLGSASTPRNADTGILGYLQEQDALSAWGGGVSRVLENAMAMKVALSL